MDILKEEFDSNPHWSKETLFRLAKQCGLSEAQVYKWGWDQKKKKIEEELMERYEYQVIAIDEKKDENPFMKKIVQQIA